MYKQAGFVSLGALLLGSMGFAQQPSNVYLDVLYLHVKPGKGVEFQAIAKKIADANRRYKGSDWMAFATAFGEGGTYMMVSRREGFAQIEQAGQMFRHALSEAFTPTGAMKLMDDAGALLTGTRSEIHRRRPDLSWNAPADQNEMNKFVGHARWLRLTTVRIRPGRNSEFEDLVRSLKDAAEKANPEMPTLVSQSMLGTEGAEYSFAGFRSSLGAYDQTQGLREILGDEGYRKFENTIADVTRGSSTSLYRIVPELSNAPAEIASVDPSFWNPKPAATAARGTQTRQPRTDSPETGAPRK